MNGCFRSKPEVTTTATSSSPVPTVLCRGRSQPDSTWAGSHPLRPEPHLLATPWVTTALPDPLEQSLLSQAWCGIGLADLLPAQAGPGWPKGTFAKVIA